MGIEPRARISVHPKGKEKEVSEGAPRESSIVWSVTINEGMTVR